MMYGYEHGWDAGGWVLMSVLILVVVGAVIVSVLSLIHSSRPRVPLPRRRPRPAGLPCGPSMSVSPAVTSTRRTTPRGGIC